MPEPWACGWPWEEAPWSPGSRGGADSIGSAVLGSKTPVPAGGGWAESRGHDQLPGWTAELAFSGPISPLRPQFPHLSHGNRSNWDCELHPHAGLPTPFRPKLSLRSPGRRLLGPPFHREQRWLQGAGWRPAAGPGQARTALAWRDRSPILLSCRLSLGNLDPLWAPGQGARGPVRPRGDPGVVGLPLVGVR